MSNNSSSVVVHSNTPDACFMTMPREFDLHNMNSPDSVHPTWTFLAAVNGLAAPPTIVVNALVIWAVVRDENLRSSPFNLLLASLAVSDFLVGLLSEPLYCLFLGCRLNNCLLLDCTFTASSLSSFLCSGSTMVSFTTASVERYLAIEHPNFYRKNITVTKIVITTLIVWIIIVGSVVITSSVFNKIHPDLFKVPAGVAASILGLVILYCSAKVQLTAYSQSRTIALQQASVQEPNEQQEQEQRLKEYKRVFTITMLVALSILFYIPFIVVTVIQDVMGKDDDQSAFKYIALPICITFINLQSLINPIIMALRLSYVRQGIKNRLAAIGLVQGTD